MSNTTIFPIHRLNQCVTEKLSKIITADIPDNINRGLRNKPELIDDGNAMTDIARVANNKLTGESYVIISAAFMQYVWLLTDIALKNIDLGIIQKEFTRCGVDYRLYPRIVDAILSMPKENVIKFCNIPVGFDIDLYLEYLKRSKPLFDVAELNHKINLNVSLLKRLTIKGETFVEGDFAGIDLNGSYEEIVNGAYCYAIAFAMLHEMSHFALGHLDITDEEYLNESEEEKKEDERNADMNAFWSIYSDSEGREQFTAIVGIFSLFFALLILNPTMDEDGEHPREDQRIFAIYEQVKGDNSKYTVLIVSMFKMWARFCNLSDFPMDVDNDENGIEQIKDFLKNFQL